MPQVVIGQAGRDPGADGEINLYRSAEAMQRSWFDDGRRVVFVNGMDNTPADHSQSAKALSLMQGCPVIGIYNRSDGFWGDIGQCLTDKLNLSGVQSGSFAAWQLVVDAAHALARQRDPSLSKEVFVGRLIADNPATSSLYNYLTSLDAGRLRAVKIFSHSQGNLITSNALTAVALVRGLPAIAGLNVNSFGSPCRNWPAGIFHVQRAFTFDPVTWLDLNAGLQFDKVGFVAGHGFLLYLEHDAEFTVNRFRWGSFAMTASMDEEGLAHYCVSIGNNPLRLKGIFSRLLDMHWSDSDDVAEIYARTMRRQYPLVLQAIARADADVIRLLIRSLDEGYTTGAERAEKEYLEALI